jgi:hypothetical protein
LLGSSPIPRSFVASCVSFQLRPLPSTGVTRLHRYNEPLRHPKTAQPVSRELPVDPYCNHRWDFPCCAWSPLPTCRRQYPGRSYGICSLVRFHPLRPSHEPGRVGSCIVGFGACSAFTHVTACMLAKSPSDSLHQRLQQSRCLPCCSDCYRVERTSSRAGIPPLWTTAFSRRTRIADNPGVNWSTGAKAETLTCDSRSTLVHWYHHDSG